MNYQQKYLKYKSKYLQIKYGHNKIFSYSYKVNYDNNDLDYKKKYLKYKSKYLDIKYGGANLALTVAKVLTPPQVKMGLIVADKLAHFHGAKLVADIASKVINEEAKKLTGKTPTVTEAQKLASGAVSLAATKLVQVTKK